MNLNLGGKQEILKETVFPPETKNLELIRTKQEMFITGPNGKRTAKGIKQVLLERGCLPDIQLKAKCIKPRCLEIISYPPLVDTKPCCLARIL